MKKGRLSPHLLKKVDENFMSRGSLAWFFRARLAVLYNTAVGYRHKYLRVRPVFVMRRSGVFFYARHFTILSTESKKFR